VPVDPNNDSRGVKICQTCGGFGKTALEPTDQYVRTFSAEGFIQKWAIVYDVNGNLK